jgi:hypothetical protein
LLASPRYQFKAYYIQAAPGDQGVYVLFEDREIIHVGLAMPRGIRASLLEHFRGLREPHSATHYAWEISLDPRSRHAELQKEIAGIRTKGPGPTC